jgi:hypothetical protein
MVVHKLPEIYVMYHFFLSDGSYDTPTHTHTQKGGHIFEVCLGGLNCTKAGCIFEVYFKRPTVYKSSRND